MVAFGNKILDFSCSYSKHMMCSTIGRNKYFFPLQAQASEAWLKAGFIVFVSLRLRVQNAVPAQPCVGKLGISLVLRNFLHCNFRLWFKTP